MNALYITRMGTSLTNLVRFVPRSRDTPPTCGDSQHRLVIHTDSLWGNNGVELVTLNPPHLQVVRPLWRVRR